MLKIHQAYQQMGFEAFPFQVQVFEKVERGYHGLLNAPTGSGKTLALAVPALLRSAEIKKGTVLLWITPLRSLANSIKEAIAEASDRLNVQWNVAVRNGDTPVSERAKQHKNPPQCLVITPESLHLILATKDASFFLRNLDMVVVDEWHELMGSKRGVLVELALSRIRGIKPNVRTWGISATIGNLQEACDILIPSAAKSVIIKADLKKNIEIHTLYPEKVEILPWAGHLGIRMLERVLPIIAENKSTLIFTNTRSQSEIWYQAILEAYPALAGRLAMHHGSLSKEVRDWVEGALENGSLKAVVCTSSLDLGVDFKPVDAVVQIGSPKGVSRFLQRAGRSGHSPGATSKIYFLPTHTLELLEALALKMASEKNLAETRIPVVRAFDVLVQYLMTLAVGEGFDEKIIYQEIIQTHCYASVSREEWQLLLAFMLHGGDSLQFYDEYNKLVLEEGKYKVKNRKMAMQHRLSIGTIAGDASMQIKFMNGSKLGTIEEYFITRLNIGDAFIFAGKMLELVKLEGTTAFVKRSTAKKGLVPSWMGGRMSLSNELGQLLRDLLAHYRDKKEELLFLKPLFELQAKRSKIPAGNELLIEYYISNEGHHLFVYPFEGRMVNEGMAMLLAYRLGKRGKFTFSIAMNDYGFELLSDTEIPIEQALEEDILDTKDLISDLYASTNYHEMAQRRFNEIAVISGLLFKGYPGKPVKGRHLQSNAKLFYKVFNEYEPHHLLLKQANEEVFYYQLEEHRLRAALNRIGSHPIHLKRIQQPTPFSFPIMVDRLSRNQLTNEKLEDKIAKLLAAH